MRKKLLLLALFVIFHSITHAQYARWMRGTWKSTNGEIQIDDVTGESFSGIKTIEASGSKITVSISGAFRGRGFYLEDGDVLQKEGSGNVQLPDCSACNLVNKMLVHGDSLILSNTIADCDKRCDGETFYYRLLTEYDSTLQRYLVDRFGRPSDIIGFQPRRPQENAMRADDDNTPLKGVTVSTPASDAKKIQAANDAGNLAQQKKRQQQATDSLNLIKQKQRTKDSLNNIARQKHIDDSILLVQQKQQQRIKDSLDNVARLEQIRLHTEDSLRNIQAEKRQQEITDSLNLVQQKEQQRIKDSLDDVAKKRLQQINDSTLLAQQKKRQQEITDSLNLANQQKQKHIKDSLESVAAANLQKQRTADSLLDVQVAKRQQEITDSLTALRKQQYDDSLQKAALAKAAPPPANEGNQPEADKALTTRTNVLLGAYHITSPDILIELFDNGEIDGDRVTIYHNNEVIVNNQLLDKKPITLNIHADASKREHEFIMVAENLGSIPPNSALMRVTAGKQSYKLSVNTDMKTNARIVFYYDGD